MNATRRECRIDVENLTTATTTNKEKVCSVLKTINSWIPLPFVVLSVIQIVLFYTEKDTELFLSKDLGRNGTALFS